MITMKNPDSVTLPIDAPALNAGKNGKSDAGFELCDFIFGKLDGSFDKKDNNFGKTDRILEQINKSLE